eukprot:175435-Amphidinium_carterae.1
MTEEACQRLDAIGRHWSHSVRSILFGPIRPRNELLLAYHNALAFDLAHMMRSALIVVVVYTFLFSWTCRRALRTKAMDDHPEAMLEILDAEREGML